MLGETVSTKGRMGAATNPVGAVDRRRKVFAADQPLREVSKLFNGIWLCGVRTR